LGKGLGASATNTLVLVLVPRPGKARLGRTGDHVRSVVADGHRPVLPSS